MTSIIDKLFLGNAADAGNLDLIRKYGITHIVNCAREVPCHFPIELSYFQLGTPDESSAFREEVARACAFARVGLKQGCVLMHCSSGASRSPAMVLAYLCHSGMSLSEARNILSARVKTQPDPLFIGSLERWFGST